MFWRWAHYNIPSLPLSSDQLGLCPLSVVPNEVLIDGIRSLSLSSLCPHGDLHGSTLSRHLWTRGRSL